MALARNLSESQIAFQITGGDPDQFRVFRYRGTEGLCQLYRFEIDAACDEPDLDLDAIVGTSATLAVETSSRWFHGIVSSIEMTGQGIDQGYFRIVLVPKLWLLTHRYDSRIFQEMTAPEIIEKVLTSAGMAGDSFRKEFEGEFTKREYCVQYRETDYNFICRLMEEEGIWWYFDQTEEAHKLVMANAKSAYKAIEGDPKLPFVPPTGLSEAGECIVEFRRGHTLRPGAVALADYNFKKPKLNLRSNGGGTRDKGLEFSDYPGRYDEQAQGKSLAGIRAEEFGARRVIATGATNSARLAPGRTFELADHAAPSFDGKYMVISVTHQGKQAIGMTTSGTGGAGRSDSDRTAFGARRNTTDWLYHGGQVVRDPVTAAHALGGRPLDSITSPNLIGDRGDVTSVDFEAPIYDASFECIPADVVYRPARVTPWPVMRGSQTARVVGPKGEEIHCDEFGRIKVQFHWDRQGKYDDKSSCWIRVCQQLAGGQYGMMFLPRVGQEVVVDFIEGNPDRPLVTGCVYNGDQKPPYKLPDEKTKSCIKTNSSTGGGGCNEIRFEDLKDKEQLLFHAQKDLHIRVKNQERHNVGESRFLVIKEEQRTKIGEHRSAAVGGKDALEVKETRSVKVKGDVYQDYGGSHDHKVASEYHVKAAKMVCEVDSGVILKCGGNSVCIDSSGVYIKGSVVHINGMPGVLPSTVVAQLASPADPEDADDVQPGKDVKYDGAPTEMAPVEEKPYEGHWVSFDLKNADGTPCAGEYYEVLKPGGKVAKGTLDVNGYARVWVEQPGDCKITYPLRMEWERA